MSKPKAKPALERIFNVFLFVEDDLIVELGCVLYERGGSDADKLAFLQEKVSSDWRTARRFKLSNDIVYINEDNVAHYRRISYQSYVQLFHAGRHMPVIEPVFEAMGNSRTPLMVVTPIVDGVLRIDEVVHRDMV